MSISTPFQPHNPSHWLTLTFSFVLWFSATVSSDSTPSNTTTTTEKPPGSPQIQISEATFPYNYTRINIVHVDDDPNGTQTATPFEAGPPKFDDKAVFRGFVVFGGLVAIVMVYLTLKFLWIRRKRRLRGAGDLGVGVYGPLQTSEMNLLHPLGHDEQTDSDDDETTHYQLPSSLSTDLAR